MGAPEGHDMAATPDEGRTEGRTEGHPAPRRARPDSPRSEQDVLQVLSEFESGLESLKVLYAERKALEARLREREQELGDRADQVEARTRELGELSARLASSQAELESFRGLVAEREAELAARLRELDDTRQSKTDDLRRAEELLSQTRQELEVQRERLTRDAHALEDRSRALEETTAELDGKFKALAKDRESIIRERREAESLRAELSQQLDEIKRREAVARDQAPRIADLESRLAAAGATIAQRDAAAAGLNATVAAFEAQVAELRLLNEATPVGEIEAREAEALARAEIAAAATRHANLTDVTLEYEALWTLERTEAARAALALAQRDQELAELEGVLDALRGRLKSEIGLRDDAATRAASSSVAHEEAAARVHGLEGELQALRTEAEGLRKRSAKSTSTGTTAAVHPAVVKALETRRRRLRRYRELVRGQAGKVRKAGDALKKRYEQCEQVMAQRAELAAARHKIIEAERRVQAQRAGGRAAAVLLCAVCILGILGGMSWAISSEVAPATFLATSVVRADGRGRELNPAELEEWQRFHEELIADPRFHEAAADRFKRQAVTTLSTPAQVAEMIRLRLTTESITPGELTLSLRDQGASRTARTLETFTAAFASNANASQQRRIDGGVTQVVQPAKAGTEPIDQTRTYWALSMLGGSAAAALLVSLLIYRRLAGAKTDFERDGHVASTLDEANWPDPTRA